MNEKDILMSHILDLKDKAATEGYITFSNFLSIDELSYILKVEKINNQYVDTFYFGGYCDCERKIAIFVPSFWQADENTLVEKLTENGYEPIKLISVQKDRFSSLNHRDYLGALMGLGIKREMIGDIIVQDDGCKLFCISSVADFICDNLRQAGRGQLSASSMPISDIEPPESKTEISFVSVASLRLDCVVAAAFKLSRNNAVNIINQGLIYVNSEQILKCDYLLKRDDKLVLRGKGKTVIDEIIGESKKGRIHINIKKYI